MNEAGIVFWLLIAAALCCAMICVGLLAAVIRASRPDDFD